MANIVLLTGSPSPREEAGINGVFEGSLSIYLGPKVAVESWAGLLPPIVVQTAGGGAGSHNPLCRGDIQQRLYKTTKNSTSIARIDAHRSQD
jgi:hypothetical protein